MTMEILDKDIGGARVRRVFSRNGEPVKPDSWLTRDEVLSIPIANRRALRDAGYIELFPLSNIETAAERFLVESGKGKYDVIAGQKLNKKPLSKKEAEQLVNA